MKKTAKILLIVLAVWMSLGFIGLVRDKAALRHNIVRLHVVAHSDTPADQTLKLQVRDAVVAYLETNLSCCEDVTQVKQYLSTNLDSLQTVAEATLRSQNSEKEVTVTLGKESFPVRQYDTFSLPSGVYESLRICIGDAAGQNWWCVVFPTLCVPTSSQEVQDVAAGAGFTQELGNTLTGEEGYEVRFLLLDLLGRLENILH
jgi:stage II sporulation protein R